MSGGFSCCGRALVPTEKQSVADKSIWGEGRYDFNPETSGGRGGTARKRPLRTFVVGRGLGGGESEVRAGVRRAEG